MDDLSAALDEAIRNKDKPKEHYLVKVTDKIIEDAAKYHKSNLPYIEHTPIFKQAKCSALIFADEKSAKAATLTCSICTCPFIDPVSPPCSHSFCSLCINKWRDEHATCPVCRGSIAPLLPSFDLKKQLEEIQMACPNEGCIEKGNRATMEKHLKFDGCLSEQGECSICEVRLTRGKFQQEHVRKCFRYLCPNSPDCQWVGTNPFSDHVKKCPLQPLPCLNAEHGCQWVGPDKEKRAHINYQCKFWPCSNKLSGCPWVGLRDKQKEHLEVCSFKQSSCPKKCGYVGEDVSWHLLSCPKRGVPCRNEGCGVVCGLHLLETHEKSCSFRKVACEYECGFTGLDQDIPAHQTTCPLRVEECVCGFKCIHKLMSAHKESCAHPIRCPWGCDYSVVPQRMSAHQKVCEYRPVRCTYCGFVCPKSEMAKAHAECPSRPVSCPNAGCSFKDTQQLLQAHKAVCKYQSIQCKQCGLFYAFRNKGLHQHTCPCRIVECVYGCGFSAQEREIEAHQLSCPVSFLFDALTEEPEWG